VFFGGAVGGVDVDAVLVRLDTVVADVDTLGVVDGA
jgi:hypothetical protein